MRLGDYAYVRDTLDRPAELKVNHRGVTGFNAPVIDEIDLGHRECPRVSDITWNESRQAWDVRFIKAERWVPLDTDEPDGPTVMIRQLSRVVFRHPIREECIRWEHTQKDTIERYRAGRLPTLD